MIEVKGQFIGMVPPDQAEAARQLAVNLGALPGMVVQTLGYRGYKVEVVEWTGKTFGRFAAYTTAPGGTRRKTDCNWSQQAFALEDALVDIDRKLQEQRNAAPQFRMPPTDKNYADAAADIEG